MQAIAAVLNAVKSSKGARLQARANFLKQRNRLWKQIQDGRFPPSYVSHDGKKYIGAPRRTAIRCDFVLANKLSLGPKYAKDRVADLAQRDLLFSVLRCREMFPNRSGERFYCCRKCTAKLYECVSAKAFRYIDNAKWKAAIEHG